MALRLRTTAEVADENGLRHAFVAHGGELLGFARRAVPTMAEDAVQETFVRAWRSRHRYDASLGSMRTWLFAIERRVILDLLDRSGTMVVVGETRPETDAVDWIEDVLRGWQVEAALSRLPEEHRIVIQEMYFRGLTGKEIAEKYGWPEGTVRSRSFYALRLLRVFLEEAGWNS